MKRIDPNIKSALFDVLIHQVGNTIEAMQRVIRITEYGGGTKEDVCIVQEMLLSALEDRIDNIQRVIRKFEEDCE